MLVELLADGLRRPTFPSAHVELLRNQTLVYQQEREQDTQRMARCASTPPCMRTTSTAAR
ncbi:MAG: hypothetical protein R3A10_13550 [Caldilineaceae bacterium]